MEDRRITAKAAICGTANGVFFMAIFGTLWAYTSIMGLQRPGGTQIVLLITAILIGAALCTAGLLLLRSARKFSGSGTGSKPGKNQRFRFNLIFATEGVAIAIAIFVCNMTENTQLIPIVVNGKFRTWRHIEWSTQDDLEEELVVYEQSMDQLLTESNLIVVCAYDADRVSASLQERLQKYHDYLMKDDQIVLCGSTGKV